MNNDYARYSTPVDELKPGEKFYHDGIINKVISISSVISTKYIELRIKRLGFSDDLNTTLSLPDTWTVAKFTGRNKESFYAGFGRGIEYCMEWMNEIQKENAELGEFADLKISMLSMVEYKKWLDNTK